MSEVITGNFDEIADALQGVDGRVTLTSLEQAEWRHCQSKILNTWSGHRTAQIDPEKCRKINGREIRF